MFKSPAVATRTLILLNVLVYLGQVSSGGKLTGYLFYTPLATFIEPWRMITAGFAHSDNLLNDSTSIFHIALNMYSLYILGNLLEPMLGTRRFVTLYMLALFGGSVAVLVWAPPVDSVIGASGAVFGLMAAYLIVLRTLGQNSNMVLGIVGVNLIFSFLSPGVSWEAHIGGLITGGLVTFLYSRTRMSSQTRIQNLGIAAIAIALVGITVVRGLAILALGY